MKTNIRRAATAGRVASAALVVAPGPAGAYDTFNDHRLTYGVTGEFYWIDSHALPHIGAIDDAPEAWHHYTAQVLYSKTSTKSASRLDWYKSGTVNDWWGRTQMFVDVTQVDPENTNWVWNRIWLDNDFANCPNPKGVTVHEMGHAMGLAHVSSPTVAVMRTDIAYLAWTNPTGDDVAGVNHLY